MQYIDVPTRNFLDSMGYTPSTQVFSLDNVFLFIPKSLLTDATADAWVAKNVRQGVDMVPYGSDKWLLTYRDEHKPILDSATVALAISKGCEICSPRAAFAVEKPVATLDATMPPEYDTPAANIYDEEGNVTGRKTVREVMQFIEGDTKCLILCAEIDKRMRHEDVVRFTDYFNADYEYLDNTRKAAWIANNVSGE